MTEHATSSQTIGPFWHPLEDPSWADLTRFGAAGKRIEIAGTVTDGDDALVTDACVELWQASPDQSDDFPGFGRCATDIAGQFRFTTLRPGPLPAAGRQNVQQAPHVALTLFARGLLRGLTTRLYFPDEPLNATDPVLNLIDPARRATLIAREASPGRYVLDLRLQGVGETVFLEV